MAKEKDDSNEKSESQYIAVDVTQLRVGALVDRPLYARMQSRNKYILMARALHPLDQNVLSRFQTFGYVYSVFPPLDERYPDLVGTVHRVREIFADETLAPFERSAAFRKATLWLSDIVLKKNGDAFAAVFFLSRLLNSPRTETIQFVSDLSVDLHERSLKVASVACLLLMWVGHLDERVQKDLISAIFCEEVSIYRDDSPNLRQIALSGERYIAQDTDRAHSFSLIENGKVPGLSRLDAKITRSLSQRGKFVNFGEEFCEAVELARWICGGPGVQFRVLWESRLVRKLTKIFNFSLTGSSKNPEQKQKVAA